MGRSNARSRLLSRQEADRLQAARLGDALLAVAAERGYANTSVKVVLGRAAASRRTFYDVFASKAEAFETALRLSLARGARRIRAACARHDGDATGAAGDGLDALVDLICRDPGRARLCVMEAYNRPNSPASHQALREFDQLVEDFSLAPLLTQMPRADLLGALCGVILARLDAPRPALDELAPTLARLIFADPHVVVQRPRPDLPAVHPPAWASELSDGRRELDSEAVRELHDRMIDAAVHQDEATLTELCRLIELLEARGQELDAGVVMAINRLDEMCRAALAGGPAGVLAIAGFVRPRDERDLQPLVVRGLGILAARGTAAPAELREILGVNHASQVSRLLSDLSERGLAEPTGGNGTPRRWAVTDAGRAVHARVLRS